MPRLDVVLCSPVLSLPRHGRPFLQPLAPAPSLHIPSLLSLAVWITPKVCIPTFTSILAGGWRCWRRGSSDGFRDAERTFQTCSVLHKKLASACTLLYFCGRCTLGDKGVHVEKHQKQGNRDSDCANALHAPPHQGSAEPPASSFALKTLLCLQGHVSKADERVDRSGDRFRPVFEICRRMRRRLHCNAGAGGGYE